MKYEGISRIRMKKVVLFSMLNIWVIGVFGQKEVRSEYPIVGKPLPNYVLQEVKYSDQSKISFSDYRGKWMILDFFKMGCTACFESFPKVNELAKQYKESLQILLIGEDHRFVRETFEKFRKKYNLKLPMAIDSDLFEQFGVLAVPHVVYIDPDGIVRAVTSKIDKDVVDSFLRGETPDVRILLNKHQEQNTNHSFPRDTITLISEHNIQPKNIIFKSILGKYDGKSRRVVYSPFGKGHTHKLIGVSLRNLYTLAFNDTLLHFPSADGKKPNYYGKSVRFPILKVNDTSMFYGDYERKENLFTYELSISPDKYESMYQMKKILQNDLNEYFGYKVSIDSLLMPYWKLIATDKARNDLKSRKTTYSWEGKGSHTFSELTNAPVSNIVRILWAYHQTEPPFVDETNIKGNIDIRLNAIHTDLMDLRRALNENGLDIVRGQKKMKVIIIDEPSLD
ncbi:redoxin domain-containing protein [Muricauda sp. JGD-17]|uniref:Redoxin domain-containing protein n=1 Tax=Flagellimonas ochracea TaxID=2696472 RepID=A0A964TAU0_9FLAO|nr:TlpA disulfide reductase family protein [Allomuricauda ochracea]NAY91423.1 redoxin domain-containing protein [Allomuricauda ochracea]